MRARPKVSVSLDAYRRCELAAAVEMHESDESAGLGFISALCGFVQVLTGYLLHVVAAVWECGIQWIIGCPD